MKDNKGFSLVELLVVVAIMATLTGLLGISISLLVGQRVKTAAADTKSLMQSAQTVAMSKENCTVTFSPTSDGVQIVSKVGTDKELKQVDIDKNIDVKIKVAGGTEYDISSGSNTAVIFYNRETGGFQNCTINGTDAGVPLEIMLTKGSRTITLELATYTGKISMK